MPAPRSAPVARRSGPAAARNAGRSRSSRRLPGPPHRQSLCPHSLRELSASSRFAGAVTVFFAALSSQPRFRASSRPVASSGLTLRPGSDSKPFRYPEKGASLSPAVRTSHIHRESHSLRITVLHIKKYCTNAVVAFERGFGATSPLTPLISVQIIKAGHILRSSSHVADQLSASVCV